MGPIERRTRSRGGLHLGHLGLCAPARSWGGRAAAYSTANPASAAFSWLTDPTSEGGWTTLLDLGPTDLADSALFGTENNKGVVLAGVGIQANWQIGDGGGGNYVSEGGSDPEAELWGGINHNFPNFASFYNEIWFGIYKEFSSDYQFHDQGTKTGGWIGGKSDTDPVDNPNQGIFVKAHDSQPEHGPYNVSIIGQGTDNWEATSSVGSYPLGVPFQQAVRLKGNTSGASNGRARLWIESTLYIDQSGINMWSGGAMQFRGIRLDPYWGGSSDVKLVADWIKYYRIKVMGK